MLDKVGKSITDMSDDEKKKFFNAVDTAYKAKSEGRLAGYNESVNESSLSWKDVDKYANAISNLTQIDTKDVKKFIEDNKLDIEKIFAIAHKTSQGKTDFVKAIKSAPNSSIQKAYIKTYANESVNESAEILKPGTKVKLRGGKTGKVVRYDGKMGSPFYIVDIGQYYSIEVPADQIKTESVKEAELTAGQKKIDTDGDGEIEGSDLAALRNKK
jgi:hypothetical protein